MLNVTTGTDGFMDIKCDGPNGCGHEYNGVGPLWGADILSVHSASHGPANGNDSQRLASKISRSQMLRRRKEAADRKARAAAHTEFFAGRPGW